MEPTGDAVLPKRHNEFLKDDVNAYYDENKPNLNHGRILNLSNVYVLTSRSIYGTPFYMLQIFKHVYAYNWQS